MKSCNFVRRYIQFVSVMMIMILGAVLVVFLDFSTNSQSSVSAKMSALHTSADKNESGSDAIDLWSFDKDVLISVSKTAPSTYVNREQKSVSLMHLLLQNNSNDEVKLEKLSLVVENGALATNYKFFEADNLLREFAVDENGRVSLDLALSIAPSQEKQLFVQADIAESAQISQKLRVKLDTAKDIELSNSSRKLKFMGEELISPYLRIVGK